MFFSVTRKQVSRGVLILLLFCLCFLSGNTIGRVQSVMVETNKQPRIAIVIDDFGYHGEGIDEILALPIPLTVAMLPFSEDTVSDTKQAVQAGKEIIIHLPMEALHADPKWVGAKGIFRTMDDASIRQRVKEAIELVPNAVGVNNHMGSAIMEDKRSFSAVMDVIKEEGLFFLDSVTTAKSVADEVAKEKGVPILKRNVFLDGTDDLEVVKKKLRQTAEVAKKDGSAIAIGHVGPEGGKVTAKAIASLLPELEKEGISFVFLSELLE